MASLGAKLPGGAGSGTNGGGGVELLLEDAASRTVKFGDVITLGYAGRIDHAVAAPALLSSEGCVCSVFQEP